MVGGLLLRCVTFLCSVQNSDKNEAALVHNVKSNRIAAPCRCINSVPRGTKVNSSLICRITSM